MSISKSRRQQLVIAGAGLAAALIAQRLSSFGDAQITILEASDTPFGEHTWSFHLADVSPADLQWMAPMIAHRWAGQTVRFPDYERHLSTPYAALTSSSVRAAVESLENVRIRTNAPVATLSADAATLQNGERVEADCVIDARGFRNSSAISLGFQKFVGLDVETNAPHGILNPVIMDASVNQIDGYRFVYLLPFSPTRILIEDTHYTDEGDLDHDEIVDAIYDYAETRGWSVSKVLHRESGVLPITLAYDAEQFWADAPDDVAQIGMRAALFHPTTGYSLPDAVRVANLVARNWPVGSGALASKIRAHAVARQKGQGFYRLLNRMLFRAARSQHRHLVLQRFYRLGQPLIERFYAGESTPADMIRILTGKPPVPIHRALACLREAPFLKPEKA